MRPTTLFFVVILAGCGGVSGNGNEVTKTRELEAFKRVSIASGIELHGTVGPRALSVTTDENVFDSIETFVQGETLTMRLKPGLWLQGPTRIKAEVFNEAWEAVDASGGSEVRLSATMTETFRVSASGGSIVHVTDLTSEHLDVHASGGSIVELGGVAFDGAVAASGGSELRLGGVCLDALDVSASGGSIIAARVATRLTGEASGGSTVLVVGSPSNQVQTSGGSRVGMSEP